jgi:hypothetical protein
MLNTIGYVSSTYYNLTFCIVFSYSIRNTLKKPLFSQLGYHIFSLIVIVGFVLLIVLTSSLGRGLNGVCGMRIASR